MKTTNETNHPQMAAPKSLGGGTMPLVRTLGRKPDHLCSVPNCMWPADVECQYKLGSGKLCGHRVCSKCAGSGSEPVCPPHRNRQSGGARS